MQNILGAFSASRDGKLTYSEKTVTLAPQSQPASSAATGNGAHAAPPAEKSPSAARKSTTKASMPEGAYPLDGERTVEKAKDYYERLTRECLLKIHQASTSLPSYVSSLRVCGASVELTRLMQSSPRRACHGTASLT
jgi:hypothetical protein